MASHFIGPILYHSFPSTSARLGDRKLPLDSAYCLVSPPGRIGAAMSTTALIARLTNFCPDVLAAAVLLPAAFTNALAVFLAALTV